MVGLQEMHESKLIVVVAAACSMFAVLACLLTIPSMYNAINEIHDEVIDQVAMFRVRFHISLYIASYNNVCKKEQQSIVLLGCDKK
jgi:hypothetical protein